MKRCPYCAEKIQNKAIKCRYCGSDLKIIQVPVIPPLPIQDPTKSEKINKKKQLNNWQIGLIVICGLFLLIIIRIAINITSNKNLLVPIIDPLTSEESTPTVQPLIGETTKPISQLGKGIIEKIAYSPNGQLFAIATTSGIYLYDLDTYEEIKVISPTSWVTSFSFSNDSNFIVFGLHDGSLQVWQIANPNLLWLRKGHTDNISSIAIDTNNSIIATVSDDDTIRFWDFNSGNQLRVIEGITNNETQIIFSPNGELLLAYGDNDESIRFWKVEDGSQLSSYDIPNAQNINFLDGTTTAFSVRWKELNIWDLNNGNLLNTISLHHFNYNHVLFTPDGSNIILGYSGSNPSFICISQTSNGTMSTTITLDPYYVFSDMALAPDGEEIATAGYDSVRVLDISEGKLIHEFKGFTQAVSDIDISPDGSTIAAGYSDGVIKFWDFSTGIVVAKSIYGLSYDEPIRSVNSIKYTPDGTMLLSAHEPTLWGKTVYIWSVPDGHLLFSVETDSYNKNEIAISPDGSIFALGSCSKIQLFQTSDGNLIKLIDEPMTDVNDIDFSSDGTIIAAASGEALYDDVQLFSVSDGALIKTLKIGNYISSIDFSPDGSSIAIGGKDDWNKNVSVYKISNGKLLQSFVSFDGFIRSLAFSPDGTVLALGLNDGRVWLWRVSDGILLRSFDEHKSNVTSIIFTPDGRHLITGSADGKILIWEIK